MSELYWLTRLDGLNTFGVVIMIIGIILSVFVIVWGVAVNVETTFTKYKGFVNKCAKIIFPITFIGILMTIFIPTTKEAFLIYGVGGAVDYIKSNDTAKQLPDKCVKALDKWVDEYMLDENKENK